MSLLQRCGGILAHSSWQNCCNSATLEGFRAWTRLFKVMPQHLNRIQVRTWLGHSKSLHFCFSSAIQRWICWCVLDHCPAAEHKFASAWGHVQMAGHCPSGFFGRQAEFMVPFITASLPGPEAAKQPRPSHYHHHTLLLVWCSFSEMLCYFYARCNGTHTFQNVQLLSRQSTEYFPKSLGDNQDVFLAKLRQAFMFFLLSSGF